MKTRDKTAERPEEAPVWVSAIEEESRQLLELSKQTAAEMDAYYPQLLEADHSAAETQAKAASLKRATNNITKALAQTAAVSDELTARWSDIQKQKKRGKLLRGAPANAAIDWDERQSAHFARGLNLYKLLLICFIGSFAGVVVELLWCLVTNGYLESRSGLVYGPFNLLYGVGAVALTVCLYRFRNRGSWLSFLGGTLVGSVVEYLCSWAQEAVFGTRSWDYSHLPFNLNGRICLLYSVFWGLLGVLWIKNIYPRTVQWILRLPNRAGKILTWALTVFFVFNAAVSCAAIYRWSQRAAGEEPANRLEVLIDARFPDERMERIYANMEWTGQEA